MRLISASVACLVFFGRVKAFTTVSFSNRPRPVVGPKGDTLCVSIAQDDAAEQAIPMIAEGSVETQVEEEEKKEFGNGYYRNKEERKLVRFLLSNTIHSIQAGHTNAVEDARRAVDKIRVLLIYNAWEDGVPHSEYRPYQKPLFQAYNLWIKAIIKTVRPDPAPQAEQILQYMYQQMLVPTVEMYTSVIAAYARSGNDGPQNAERIFMKMLEKHMVNPTFQLDPAVFDEVLNAWIRMGSRETIERAYLILLRLLYLRNDQIKPTIHSYLTVLRGFADCGEAERAEEVLQSITPQDETNLDDPDRKIIPDAHEARANTAAFNAVMEAWVNSNDPRAGQQATALLRRMEQVAKKDGYDTLPNTATYNTVIAAWAKSGHMNAPEQAERVLRHMQKNALDPSKTDAPMPDTASYNNVLQVYANGAISNPEARASKMLRYMIKSGNRHIWPDYTSFAAVLNAWARSKRPDKVETACRIMKTMMEMHTKTQQKVSSVSPFNAMLNVCASVDSSMDIQVRQMGLRVAVKTFAEVREMEQLEPDVATYTNLLKCIANLMPAGDKRTNMAMMVFDQCCNAGLVGESVWDQIQVAADLERVVAALPRALRSRTFDRYGLSQTKVVDLPNVWRNKVPRIAKRKPKKLPKIETYTRTSTQYDNQG